MIRGLQLAVRAVVGIRAAMKAAIGERAAEPLVEKQEQQGDIDAFGGETVGIALAVALDQAMALQLAKIVAELV